MLLGIVASICAIGLTVLYSAGYNPEDGTSWAVKRQAISLLIGIGGFVFCAIIHPSFWKRSAFFFYVIGCALLIAVFVVGVSAGGARRWLDFAGFRLQPSETMKLAVILALAKLFSSERAPSSEGYGFWALFVPGIVLFVPAAMVIVQPDLGTGLCHLLIGGSMLLIAGVKGKILFRLALVGLVLAPIMWEFGMHDYQRQRVLTFLSPESDPLGSGYHAMQSKIAVGSGALAGKGFLEGTQTQLRFLPEQTTDFIFSVLAEEWGFLGSLVLISLYALLVVRLIRIAGTHQDRFAAFFTFGAAAMIFWHVVINIGMVIGILPVVGLTLAFLSYGGSSLMTILAALGIVVGSSIRRYSFST